MKEKILFVDDDPDIVRLVKETLLDEGFDFISAEDGEDGLKRELEDIGPLGVIAIAVILSMAFTLLLTLWVIS